MAFLHINTHTTHNSSIRSDEGLTLETSALEFFTVAKLPSSRLGDFRLLCIVIKLQKNLVQKKKNWFTCRLQARTTLISCSWRTEPEAYGRCFHFKSTVKKFFFPFSFFSCFMLCWEINLSQVQFYITLITNSNSRTKTGLFSRSFDKPHSLLNSQVVVMNFHSL